MGPSPRYSQRLCCPGPVVPRASGAAHTASWYFSRAPSGVQAMSMTGEVPWCPLERPAALLLIMVIASLSRMVMEETKIKSRLCLLRAAAFVAWKRTSFGADWPGPNLSPLVWPGELLALRVLSSPVRQGCHCLHGGRGRRSGPLPCGAAARSWVVGCPDAVHPRVLGERQWQKLVAGSGAWSRGGQRGQGCMPAPRTAAPESGPAPGPGSVQEAGGVDQPTTKMLHTVSGLLRTWPLRCLHECQPVLPRGLRLRGQCAPPRGLV